MSKPRLLMCTPDYFGVEYAINPWMNDHIGKVHNGTATEQWRDFYQQIKAHATIHLLEPRPNLPDLVFTANAGLVFGNRFIPSRFRHAQRQREESLIKSWFRSNGYSIHELPEGIAFEGAGDALLQPDTDRLWAACGPRTDREALPCIESLYGGEFISLQLVDPRFYHLDTCFCLLPDGYVLVYPRAFDADSMRKIKSRFDDAHRIEVPEADAHAFACNAVWVGNTLFMNFASHELAARLGRAGFSVVVQPVWEFIKAGGANKCLTLELGQECSQTAETVRHVA